MNRLSVICNTPNVDFEYMFSSKLECQEVTLFCANLSISRNYRKVLTSSISKSNNLNLRFWVDCFISFYIAFIHIAKRIDIVIFDSAHISNIPLAVILKVFGVKLVFSIHDWSPHPGRSYNNVVKYNKFVEKYLADGFICFSNATITTDKKVFRTTLSGFPKNSVSQVAKDEGIILFFGRMEPYKGVEQIPGIVSLLRSKGIYNEVVVAGSGDESSLLRLKHIAGVTVMNRFISDEEVDSLFGRAIVSMLPYKSATQSGVVLVSFSYGVPVVAYDVGSLGEYVEEGVTGMLVEPGDTEAFSDSVSKIIHNSSEQFRNKVFEHFVDNYSQDATKRYFKTIVLRIFKELS